MGAIGTRLSPRPLLRVACASLEVARALGFESARRAGEAKIWLDSEEGQKTMKDAFNSTSRFARLQTMKTTIAGKKLFIRFTRRSAGEAYSPQYEWRQDH